MKRTDAIKYLTHKVKDDEEVFIVRAADKCAAPTIFNWTALATLAGAPAAKINNAYECGIRMQEYPHKKVPD